MSDSQSQIRKQVTRLTLACVLMFGFGFALVPLYDVFCDITGLNGKVTRTGPASEPMVIDHSRKVRLQLTAVHNDAMPWRFVPNSKVIEIHPGLTGRTHFIAANPTDRLMIAQAVPSVAPAEAADYLQKVNCFCFERQQLAPGETQDMPLVFVIDPALPEHIRTITLSYTLFDITPQHKVGLMTVPVTQRYSL